MGIFKEINCACCGQKTSLLTRMKLHDGNYLCSTCTAKIPSFMKESVKTHYELNDYMTFLEYIEYSNRELRSRFHETHYYYSIHIDTENKLFYLGYDMNEKTVFFNFHSIEDFDLIFKAEVLKEGVLGDKVKGELLLILKMNIPYFYHEEILDYSAKAKAKKKLLTNTVEYDNPKGMNEFLLFFQTAWSASLEEAYAQEQCENASSNTTMSTELQQAMALFMIDRIEDLTIDKIKMQRNRLIKAFHPDKGSSDDTAYAQKINNAYEFLQQYVAQ